MGNIPEETGGRGGEKEHVHWRTWSCSAGTLGTMDEREDSTRKPVLFTVCLCFFQVENFNSWFRAVRTCAHP